jgi:hypothetical protein
MSKDVPSDGHVCHHHHPFNAHTLYGIPATPPADQHPQLPLPSADRDDTPQRATDLCRAVEGLIHESRFESFERWLSASATPFQTRCGVTLTLLFPLHSGLLGRNCVGCGEHKQPLIWGRRAEERVEIDQDLRRERGGTRGMVNGQPGIIAENEWVGPKRFGTVLAPLRKTPNSCRDQRCSSFTMSIWSFSFTDPCQSTRSSPRSRLSRRSVGNGRQDGKGVCQVGLPNGVKDVMR